MDDLRELYQATILDHKKNPRNFGELTEPSHRADGNNPLCGDKLTVYLSVDEDGSVRDVAFIGRGCAISTASASLMTEFVMGKSRKEIDEIFDRFNEVVVGNPAEEADPDGLGKLAVFSGVREYPTRVKCATLAWHTLIAALDGAGEIAKTE